MSTTSRLAVGTLVSAGLLVALTFAASPLVQASSTMAPSDGHRLVVAGAGSDFGSPTSENRLYVKRNADDTPGSASVTLTTAHGSARFIFSITGLDASGTACSGANSTSFNVGNGASLTSPSGSGYKITGNVDQESVSYDVYCVFVTTAYSGDVPFYLSTGAPNLLANQRSSSSGTGYGNDDDPSSLGGTWSKTVSFGTPCKSAASFSSLYFYDLDIGRVWGVKTPVTQANIPVTVTKRSLLDDSGGPVAMAGSISGGYITAPGEHMTHTIVPVEGWLGGYAYTVTLGNIQDVNSIKIGLPSDEIYDNFSCKPLDNKDGAISASCVAGVVSVQANINGDDDKDYVVVITQPNGVTQTRTRTGSGSLVFDNFSWPMNGVSASVSGTIALTAPPGSPTKALAPGTFVCLSSIVDPRCPENPTFFGVDLWKPNIGVTRPLPAAVGTDGGYTASDYKIYSYKNDDLQNIEVTATSGGIDMPLPHKDDNISVQADYQDLVNTYPYDTHAVAGTANFVYVETYKQLISVTATWTRTVETAASYTKQQWSGTSPGAGWYSIGQRGGETVLVWQTTAPKGYTATGNSRENAKGETEYEYIGTTPIEYLWETVVPATLEPQETTTTAYTAPLAPARGAYPESWALKSAVASYQPDVKTEKSANATILFPTLTDCLYRKLTITLESARAPTWDNLEAPSTATFYTELIALFEPTDPSRTSLRELNRANAGAVTFTPKYQVSGRPLTFHTSGDFKLPTSSPSIPLGGTTMGFGTRTFNSSDILSVSRTGGGTIVNLDDILCGSMKGEPKVLYVNSSGVMVRNAGGITEYTLSCDAATICTAFGGGQCIENHPYFRFFNSDAVVSGMPFAPAPPTPCTASGDVNASIRGFTSSSGRGASSQVGLMAPGDITGVASSIPSDLTGTRLTLGNLGLSGDCITNLYDAPSLEKVVSWPGVGGVVDDIAYQVNGNLSIAGGTVPSGVRSAVYVDGNVTIIGNINYAGSGSYATTTAMPYFMIVATGSIYIDNSVTSIDAVLVSQGGQVSTCTDADRTCTNNFILNGAVVANQLRPRRTAGTPVYSVANEQPFSGNIGDTFRMIPEVILARPPLPKDSNTLKYDSITELPPIF